MTITPLPLETSAASGFTHKVTITHADLTDADTSQTLAIYPESGSFAAGTCVTRVGYNLVTEFDDAEDAVSDMNLYVGDDGSTTRWVNGVEVSEKGTAVAYGISATANCYTAANTVDAIFITTGGNLDTLDTGEVQIYLAVTDLNSLETA